MLSGCSLTLFLVGIVSYLLLRSIYRLYFHPLSKFPGPKIAAVTHLHEFYYDVIRNGMYIWEIEKMHVKYGGPIVRINPREVHIKDPYYYEEIYASGTRKRDKDPAFVVTYTAPHSMISTTDHNHHRFRRSLLNTFFSKKSILHLSSVIEERVQKLMERFGESHENRSVLELDAAFAGLTADIIMQYCCGQSWGFLEDENFKNDFRKAVNEGAAYIHIFRFFPLLVSMLRLMPQRLLYQVQAGRASIYKLQRWVYEQSIASVRPEQNQKKSTITTCKTIFDALTDPAIPADERTLGRLQDEGLVILCAATETTARALTLAAFHLTQEPSMMLKLREELRQVMPTPNSPITWPQLEPLPYLTGIVNEALRLSHGLVTRLPRIAPTEALRYNDYLIPPGTPVSTSSYFVHLDPLIFPHPHSFMPERWLLATEKGEKLNRFLVSFTKGSRACLGMNLAYAELYYTISRFARRFDLELYQTTLDDIRIVRDLGFGITKNGDLKVRARITGVVQA